MLNPNETELVGQWLAQDSRVVGDDVCRRIDELISSKLERLADGNWTILYRDPGDGRFWEKTYPQGHLQGGGPPALKCISSEEAYARYSIVPNSQFDTDASRRST